MTRSRLTRTGLGAGISAVVLALPLGALAGSQVPLKGGDVGGFGPGDHACSPGYDALDIDGVGHATQVGRYTYHADECFNGATLLFTGSFSITAANGDRITGTYSGEVPVIAFPLAVYEQDMIVTGGTGRFADASGQLHGRGVANLATGDYSQELAGTATSPGSVNGS